MNMIRTVRRDVLLRMMMKGEIEAKNTFNFTDGYPEPTVADWLPARIKGDDDAPTNGEATFYPSDFRSGSGYAVENKDGTYTFRIHSNAVFTLRKKGTAL